MRFILFISLSIIFPVATIAQSWTQLNTEFIKLYNNDEFEKAAVIGEKAKLAAKKEFGEMNQTYALSLYNLATAYLETRDYKKAEPLFMQAKTIQQKVLGEKNADYASTLNDLARLYAETKQYTKAESLYLQAMQIRKETLGENDPDYGTTLNDLATLYIVMKQYTKAEPLFLESKQITEKTTGTSDPEYITTINNLAILYDSMKLYEKAELFYVEVNKFYKDHPGEKNADYDSSLNKLALLYDKLVLQNEKMGKYAAVETYYLLEAGIDKERFGEISKEYAATINNMALIYSVIGDYEKAEPLYLQSAAIRKKLLGDHAPDYAMSLNNLATHYMDMGLYEKAESYYFQAIDIAQNNPDKNNTDYLTFLNNIASLYTEMGKYDVAEPLLFNLKEVQKKVFGENDPSYATALNNLANIYFKTGQFEKVEPLYIASLAILKKTYGGQSPEYATTLNNLAFLYTTTGQYAKAEPLYLLTLGIQKKVLGENSADYANSLNNLALLYTDIDQQEKAASLYVQAKDIRKQLLGEMNPDYAASLNNLAYTYMDLGRYDSAELFFIQARDIMKKTLGEEHPSYAVALDNLSGLYVRTGQFDKAEPGLLQAGKIVLKNILTTFSVLSENEKNNYLENNNYFFETNNSFLYQNKNASAEIKINNFNLQMVLTSASLSDTKNMIESLQHNPDTSLRKLFSTWMSNRKLLAKQYSLPAGSRRKDLQKMEEQTEQEEKDLNRLSSEFRDQQEALQITMQDVQKNLEPDEAAIEFARFPLRNTNENDRVIYAAYIIHKNDLSPEFVPLCDEKQLQRLFDNAGKTPATLIKTFYRGLEIQNKGNLFLGDSLFKLIWQPLEPYLKGIKKIAYSPAGKLYSIAFHALPVDSQTLLMDKYQLQQYTSLRQVVLRSSSKTTSSPNNAVLFGDPSFAMDSLQLVKQRSKQPATQNVSVSVYSVKSRGNSGGIWNSLPGTGEEIKKIQQLFVQNKVSTKLFTQTTASEENLKALSSNSPQILHIATHGFFLPEPDAKKGERGADQGNAYTLADDPLLRSGIVLAGGNYVWGGKPPVAGVEDGIVTAYEISQLNLSNTELVVLSACETALGEVKGNEGVFGLQRAFKMAGVKKMLVSLWQVPDNETAELMTSFYNYWIKGERINDAFSQAQADMRKKYAPFYWAAFVLVE